MNNNIDVSRTGKLKRNTPEGKIFMSELDELEQLIGDERAHSKIFNISGGFVSFFGAPTLHILQQSPSLKVDDILRTLSNVSAYYTLAFMLFIICIVVLIFFMG